MEDACGVSPSLPAGGSCLPKQTYFVSEWKSAIFFFFPFSSFFFPPHPTKISGKAEQGHEKQTSALELGTGTCPKPVGSARGLLGAHRARSIHPDPGFSQELGSPKSALEEEFSGF